MPMKYNLGLPQAGWTIDPTGLKNPVDVYEMMTHVAQEAEALGFDSVWLADHLSSVPQPVPLTVGIPQGDSTVSSSVDERDPQRLRDITFECWTSLAALARDTKRVRIAPMVTCNGYRNPALLAKMASTVDVLSHGRLTLGIGAGDLESEFRAYGYDCPEVSVRLRQLREAVQVILAMWSAEEATFEGTYYQVRGATNQPKGVQQPHIPLLIGGEGEKVTLKLVAHYADACNVTGDPARLEHKFGVLKAHCEAIGRDYQSIYRTAGAICVIGDTDEQALAKIPDAFKAVWGEAILPMSLIGSPRTIRQRLVAYEAVGVQEVRLRFLGDDLLASIRRFLGECIP